MHAKSGFYIKSVNGSKVHFGTPLSTQNEQGVDVGLVEVFQELHGRICNQVTDKYGRLKTIKLYNGSRKDIYGQKVFKCQSHSFSERNMNNTYEEIYGMVCSEQYHDTMFGDKISQFCVKDFGRKAFSKPGNSGMAVAFANKQASNIIEILGIVVGGYESSCTNCIYLPCAIEQLKADYCMNLEMFMVEVELQTIESGIKIFLIKTPEQISPYNFDLVQFVIGIAGLKFQKYKGNHELLAHAQMLRKLLNFRSSIDTASDRPEYTLVENGFKAADCLIAGKFKMSEEKLKIAMKCVPKCEKVALRFFPKCFAYVAWLYVLRNDKESRRQLEGLLQEGVEFCEEYEEYDGFPRESKGYVYYQLSRYYIQQYEVFLNDQRFEDAKEARVKAVENIRLSLQVMKNVDEVSQTPASLIRKLLVQCELAFTLLGCGNSFGVAKEVHSLPTSWEIQEADCLLEHVRKFAVLVKDELFKEHSIQFNIYLISLCDLFFRQKNYKVALSVAEKCFSEASKKRDIWGTSRSKRRIEILKTYVEH